MNIVSNFEVRLQETEIVENLRREGRGPATASNRLKALIHESLAMAKKEARPTAAYQWVDLVKVDGASFISGISGATRIRSHVLQRVLRYCDQAVVFVTTLGLDMDRLICKAASIGIYYGFVMDFVASRLAEQSAESFQRGFEKTLPSHRSMTLRYSPGYCDWPLDQQEDLFHILKDNHIGVRLNQHCLMQPEKSISGIIGVGPKDLIENTKNACRACRRNDCNHRRNI